MKLTRSLRAVAVGFLATAITSGVLYAAGNYSTYPIVGGAAFCVSTVGVNGQQGITGQGGGSAGVAGAYCAQTVPAGPPIVTGNELIPADTGLSGGAPPQTVVLTLASLNALPIPVSTVTGSTFTVAANPLAGGAFLHLGTGQGAAMTAVTVDLPAAPIDGQQFAVSGDANVTTLTMTAVNSPAGVTISNNPTTMTTTTTGPFGYRFRYNAALNVWNRLQ